MALTEAQTVCFETLHKAFENNDVALVECHLRETGEKVAVICAVNWDGEEYEMVPFAQLFTGNPYETLMSPMEWDEQEATNK